MDTACAERRNLQKHFFKNHHILLALSCTTSCPLVGATDPSNQRKADSEATTALSSTPAIISLLCNISQLSEQCLTFLVTELVPSFFIYCANDYLFFVFFSLCICKCSHVIYLHTKTYDKRLLILKLDITSDPHLSDAFFPKTKTTTSEMLKMMRWNVWPHRGYILQPVVSPHFPL